MYPSRAVAVPAQSSAVVGVYEVDCTSEQGRPACTEQAVRGYPTVKVRARPFCEHAKKAEVALVTGRVEVRSTALLPGIVPSSGRSRCSSVPRALPRAQRCACCCALVRQYWKRGVPAEGVKYSVSRPLLWPSARACARARLAGLQPPLVARGSEPLLHSRRRLTRVLPAHLADTRRAHALTKGCWSSPRCDSRVLVRQTVVIRGWLCPPLGSECGTVEITLRSWNRPILADSLLPKKSGSFCDRWRVGA